MSEEYNKHTVVELKALLTEKGLPVTGKKAELVQRLVENETGVPQVASTEITREGNNGGEVVPSSAVADATTETSIPNEAGQTSQVEITPNMNTSFSSTPATTVIEPGTGKTPADVELEKRRARAAKFGVPFEEPKTTPAASTATPPTPKPAVSEAKKEPAPVSAAPTGESEEALAKRRAKWGVVEKPGTMQKVKGKLVEKAEAVKAALGGDKQEAPVATESKQETTPVEKTPQQIEDERKRLARENRFKSSVPVDNNATANTEGGSLVMGVAPTLEESNGTANGIEKRKIEEEAGSEPAEKKIKV